MRGDRRLEAENYLAGGYATRLEIENQKDGWLHMSRLANVWQPSRLKGILVAANFGTPFLAATQLFDLRPVPRKWLSLDRTENAEERLVRNGMILVTRSGSVGRATLAFDPHKNTLISDDLLRVEANSPEWLGWIYAYLRSPTAREIMGAAQYGHIIKHLEVSHLNAVPVPLPSAQVRTAFNDAVEKILKLRNRGFASLLDAEALYGEVIGIPELSNNGESGFQVNASSLWSGRRRLEGFFYNPVVRGIRQHLKARGIECVRIRDVGYDTWLPTRFKRITALQGVPLLDSSDFFEINPDISRVIADGDFGDRNRGRVERGWLLMARSGQIYGLNGSVTLATAFHENKVVSDDIIRIAPSQTADMRAGYLYVALSHPKLGRPLVKALIYGSSIPHVEVADLNNLEIPRLKPADESRIADVAEAGANMMAEADLLEVDIASRAQTLVQRFLANDRAEIVPSV